MPQRHGVSHRRMWRGGLVNCRSRTPQRDIGDKVSTKVTRPDVAQDKRPTVNVPNISPLPCSHADMSDAHTHLRGDDCVCAFVCVCLCVSSFGGRANFCPFCEGSALLARLQSP